MTGGNYQMLKLVATGGTAVLYKAVQTSLDRVVAVKKLHSHLTEDENFTRRFELEAKAAASLDHENIVKIIDFGESDGSYQMVMEFIEGESLRSILDRWKKIPPDTALAVVHQVCQGLEHAHAKGIVHRDIKPGNIMVTTSGKAKITDFGLAKLTQTATQHTAVDSILGTPLYMSPEQAFGESVDHRSDIFSLGTMLYELLTGIQPFNDDNYMAVIQNIIHRNAPHPSRFEIDVPAPVQNILVKAMNKSRDARYQTAGDFKKAIEKCLGLARLKEANDSLKALLSPDGDTLLLPKTIETRARKSRLRRGIQAALVAAPLFGAAGTAAYWFGPETLRASMRELASMAEEQLPFPRSLQYGQQPGDDLASALAGLVPADSAAPARPQSSPTGAAGQGDSSLAGLHGYPLAAADSSSAAATIDPPASVSAADSRPSPQDSSGASAPSSSPTAVQSSPPGTSAPASQKESAPSEATPAVRTGWLTVTADPWAEIYIDGIYRGDSPPARRIEITRGPHSLECRNPKYATYQESVHITPGELSNRTVILKKLVGVVRLHTVEGAEVLVDGVKVGITPLAKPLELDVGDHLLTVKKAGYNVWNNQITVGANDVLSLNITLSPMY